jgi:hypothetical protein
MHFHGDSDNSKFMAVLDAAEGSASKRNLIDLCKGRITPSQKILTPIENQL